MRNFAKVLSVTVIIALLFTLGGCSALTKKITDEAKIKISEQLEETDDEDDEDTEDTEDTEETEDAEDTEADATETTDDTTNGDSTAITTSEGKGMDWPTDKMGDVSPISCKIIAVFTDENIGSVTFEGMERKEADKYLADFESLGYKNGAITEDESGVFFLKTNEAGDSVWFTYAPDGTGLIFYTAAG